MTTTLQGLSFSLARSLENLRSGALGSGAAVLVLFFAHLLAGGLVLVFVAAHGIAPALFPESRVLAVLQPDVPEERLAELVETLRSWPEVADPATIRGEAARAEASARLGRRRAVLGALGATAFPPAIEMTIRREARTPEAERAVAERLRSLSEVADVVSSSEWEEELGSLPKTLRKTGFWCMAVLGVAAALLVFLSVRHSVNLRRQETAISRALGASDFFAWAPFVFEGVLLGVAGALPAAVVVLAGAAALSHFLPLPWAVLLPWGTKELAGVFALLLLLGVASGALGSWLAVRFCNDRHLPEAL